MIPWPWFKSSYVKLLESERERLLAENARLHAEHVQAKMDQAVAKVTGFATCSKCKRVVARYTREGDSVICENCK